MPRQKVSFDQYIVKRPVAFNMTREEIERLERLADSLGTNRHQLGLKALRIGIGVIQAERATHPAQS